MIDRGHHPPRLPGNPRTPLRLRHMHGAPAARHEARTDAEISAEILCELAAGPLATGRLKHRVGTSDDRLRRCLESLQKAGEIKRGGKKCVLRWSLFAWDGPEPVGNYNRTIVPPKVEAPASSWWTDADRDEFSRRLREQIPRITQSPMAQFVRPTLLS